MTAFEIANFISDIVHARTGLNVDLVENGQNGDSWRLKLRARKTVVGMFTIDRLSDNNGVIGARLQGAANATEYGDDLYHLIVELRELEVLFRSDAK